MHHVEVFRGGNARVTLQLIEFHLMRERQNQDRGQADLSVLWTVPITDARAISIGRPMFS
ncbi:MAG: hypothetical protein JWM11_221 [Planctomycetaceae bacterium]|nr:hypothetical protein [Planctomycetaceae bacterium]